MPEERDVLERRLSRQDLLKLAAATGGAGLVAGPAGLARAANAQLAAESGRLQVLDWAGYGNDGGQSMFAQYVKTHPKNKPQFTYMGNEADALAKIHAGLKPDLFRPYVGWVKYFATSGLVQPWDTSLISNFKHLNPFMVKAGQYQGKQYGIPDDWGFDAILYRADKVKPRERSWSLLWDERYKGTIAWVGMFMLLKGTKRPQLAHAYVDAWSSAKSGGWLEDNYGYGHANTLARPSSSDLLRALQLNNPRAVAEPNAHLDRDVPRRALYAKM